MTTLVAIALTAVVVGFSVAFVVQRRATATLTSALGGRVGADPVAEHRRLLAEAKAEADDAVERANFLTLALDALTTGVVVTDVDGTVLVRNRRASEWSTQSHEKTLVDAATAELLDLALQGSSVDREIEVYGPPARFLAVSASPISADGSVIGALAIIDDVSDQHRIDKTRRDFVANLSHELRTPVGAVSLLSEMLTDEDDVATRAQLTDRLLVETNRMSETIDALLELSRIEASADRYDEAIIVRELIDEALARTRVAAESTDVWVTADVPDKHVKLYGNRTQLCSALVNLVENAIKYSSAGDAVTVSTRATDQALALIVKDTGRGIPQRDLERVFERFYRVDRSRDSATGGTGIGLSIVRHVALNHGGTVEVDSFEGEGSTFTLHLPLASA